MSGQYTQQPTLDTISQSTNGKTLTRAEMFPPAVPRKAQQWRKPDGSCTYTAQSFRYVQEFNRKRAPPHSTLLAALGIVYWSIVVYTKQSNVQQQQQQTFSKEIKALYIGKKALHNKIICWGIFFFSNAMSISCILYTSKFTS